jgi:chorismate dehydratase
MDFPRPPSCSLRLGAVCFLNMLPLTHGLERVAPRWPVIAAPPSRLLGHLLAGDVDVAMLPAYDYLSNRERFGLLPGSAIAARGACGSVFILSDVPMAEARSLELDANSHTSNALARLLARDPLDRPDLRTVEEPDCPAESRPGEPESTPRHPETCVRIGNRAMRMRKDYAHAIDLGEAWVRWQGLPFVFAVWATRGDKPWPEIADFLAALRAHNLAHIEEIVAATPQALPRGVTPAEAVRYFREHLCYEQGEGERRGLERFRELAFP